MTQVSGLEQTRRRLTKKSWAETPTIKAHHACAPPSPIEIMIGLDWPRANNGLFHLRQIRSSKREESRETLNAPHAMTGLVQGYASACYNLAVVVIDPSIVDEGVKVPCLCDILRLNYA